MATPEIQKLWQVVVEKVKVRSVLPSLWRAMEGCRPLIIEDGVLVLAFPPSVAHGASLLVASNQLGRYDIYRVALVDGSAARLTNDTRYEVCRTYHCGWRALGQLGEEWRPDKSGVLIDFQVEEFTNVYPMVAPGKSNADMIRRGRPVEN